jgi:hypothetical protein
MAADPRPRTARHADGQPDTETERRFETLFAQCRKPTSARPTDLATALTFLQELHDRLSKPVR